MGRKRRACARRRLHLVSRGRHRQPGRTHVEQGDYRKARARFEESLELFRQLGDERKIVESLVRLVPSRSRGPQRRSQNAPAREPRVRPDAVRQGTGDLVPRRAGRGSPSPMDHGSGWPNSRVRSKGCVEETGYVAQGDEWRLTEQTRNALASELGEKRLAAALTAGREMTFDQAMADTLQKSGDQYLPAATGPDRRAGGGEQLGATGHAAERNTTSDWRSRRSPPDPGRRKFSRGSSPSFLVWLMGELERFKVATRLGAVPRRVSECPNAQTAVGVDPRKPADW